MPVHDSTQTVPQAAAPAAAGRKLGLALLVIATAQLMLVLDDTIVNIALPSMQRSLHLPASSLNWVISFYALTFGGLLLAGGRAGDLFGRLRVFRTGLVLFTLASMAGGFAPNQTVLVTARIVQGCGAALAAPCALSLLATTFPAGPARTKALGVYGSMAGLGSVIGLLLGGTLTEYASWRWVLFINAPIAVAVLAGTWSGVLVPGDTERGKLDVPGAVTATGGVASLIYALSRGSSNGWTDVGTLVAFALGAVLLIAFALAERFSRAPMLPASVIRDRNRGGAYTVLLLLGTGMLAMYYLLTLYMQIVRGYSALHTGLSYLPNVVGLGIAAGGLGPRLFAALPARAVIAAGMLISAGGLAMERRDADPDLELLRGAAPGHAGHRHRHRPDVRRLHVDRHAGRRAARLRRRVRPAEYQRAVRRRARHRRARGHRLGGDQKPADRTRLRSGAHPRILRRPPGGRRHLHGRRHRRGAHHQRPPQRRSTARQLSARPGSRRARDQPRPEATSRRSTRAL